MALPVTEESAVGQTDPKWHSSNSNGTRSPQSSGNEPSSRSSIVFPEEEDRYQIEQESDEYDGCVADEWQDSNTCPAPRSGGVTYGWNLPPTEACDPGSKFSSANQCDSLAPGRKTKQHSGEESDFWAPGSGGDPLHDVLVWMDFANVDEQLSCAEAGGTGQSCRNDGAVVINEGECYLAADEERNQHSPKVPCDEEARPRPPPYAAHVSLMPSETLWNPATAALKNQSHEVPRVRPLPLGASLWKHDVGISRCSPRLAADEVVVDRDEEEWLARKKLTGAIGRLVFYRKDQKPIEDILGLCRTRKGRLKVTALRPGGTAFLAGVEVGDQLISINGRMPDESLLAETVRMGLRAPSTLVFMGFAGKLQAEVRVRQPDEPPCGLPAYMDVAATALKHGRAKNAQIELCDAVVFQQATASMLLEVARDETSIPDADGSPVLPTIASATSEKTRTIMEDSADKPAGTAEELQGAESQQKQQQRQQRQQQQQSSCGQNADAPRQTALAPRGNSCVYMLQREDARRLVKRALHTNTQAS
mmetsp:Transcript_8585/g.16180  ORF Transcript_8585/g.16180 Transcript_8585/m.16180 type:complete len:534 (+) Transcript_8585:49-1650(+)